MINLREAAQMALDALNNFDKGNHGMRWQVPVIKALRTALAQPEETVNGWPLYSGLPKPEPKNKFNPDWDAIAVMVEEQQRMAKRIEELTQLVTSQGIRLMDSEAQSKKEWVGLTYEDVEKVASLTKAKIIDVIEAKLKEKNT